MNVQRGGQTLKTGKIGRVNCLRQQMLAPGEVMNTDISGQVRLESLRERDSLRINAHLAVFVTPIRWLWDSWPDFIKEGQDTVLTPPTASGNNLSSIGVGAYNPAVTSVQRFWVDSLLRIYNEWYKWPENPDITSWPDDGPAAVPLQHIWNRCRYNAEPSDPNDYTVTTGGSDFDVRALATIQARFRSGMDRDVMSYNRYMELLQDMYGAKGSREVDKVPIMIDSSEVGVNPRDLPAMDAAGLGEWQSIFDFRVDHSTRGISFPEHCIVSYMLVIRFAPLIEGRHPLAIDTLTWEEQVMDVDILGSAMPQEVQLREVAATNATTVLGYHPAGWQWRAAHDVIGKRIDERDSFPYMETPTSQENAKDATRIKQAFRSQSLGDYLVDCYFHENIRSPLGTSKESYFAGMEGFKDRSEFPDQGKML